MPWKEIRPMDQKILFIADYLRGGYTFKDLCMMYGISRKTGYKWVNRYTEFLSLCPVGVLRQFSRYSGYFCRQIYYCRRLTVLLGCVK